MKPWVIYAIIAAIFISIRDIVSNGLIKRMDYINYVIIANIIVFIVTIIYLNVSDYKLKKPSKSDLSIILIRLFIIYLIIEPSVFQALKGTSNPGYAKSLININTLFVFILGVIFLNAEITFDKIFGMCAILIGAYFIIR